MATPLTGPGNAIDAPFDNTTTCDVSCTVTDVYGQSSNSSDPVTLLINPANGPEPVINNGTAEINATGVSSVTLTNEGTSCPAGNCTTTWALSCPDDRGSFSNRTGSSISVSVGSGGSFDIDTTGATEPFNCEWGVAWQHGGCRRSGVSLLAAVKNDTCRSAPGVTSVQQLHDLPWP